MTLQQILIFEQNVYPDAPQLRYSTVQANWTERTVPLIPMTNYCTFETRIKDAYTPVMDGIQIGRHKLLRFQKQIAHKTGILGARVSQWEPPTPQQKGAHYCRVRSWAAFYPIRCHSSFLPSLSSCIASKPRVHSLSVVVKPLRWGDICQVFLKIKELTWYNI